MRGPGPVFPRPGRPGTPPVPPLRPSYSAGPSHSGGLAEIRSSKSLLMGESTWKFRTPEQIKRQGSSNCAQACASAALSRSSCGLRGTVGSPRISNAGHEQPAGRHTLSYTLWLGPRALQVLGLLFLVTAALNGLVFPMLLAFDGPVRTSSGWLRTF